MFRLFKEVEGKIIIKVFITIFSQTLTIRTFPSNTTWTFCNGPNLENSLSSSRSVVYKLRPNTPRQVPSSGFSRLPTCLLLADIGDLLQDFLRLDPPPRFGEYDLDLDLESLRPYRGDRDREREYRDLPLADIFSCYYNYVLK